jgi:predicted lipoprotein with Yx(FWY)xxD motif
MPTNDHSAVASLAASPRTTAAIAAVAVLAAAVCLLVNPAAGHTTTVTPGVVGTGTSSLGRILVDSRGRTLYLFEKDKNGKSACSGSCATAWPPVLTSGKPSATAGVKASLLGTTRRADGRLQVTYNGHPLYTFVKDTKKGQANGENVDAFGAEWYAVSAAGTKVEKKSEDADAKATSGSSGYGY